MRGRGRRHEAFTCFALRCLTVSSECPLTVVVSWCWELPLLHSTRRNEALVEREWYVSGIPRVQPLYVARRVWRISFICAGNSGGFSEEDYNITSPAETTVGLWTVSPQAIDIFFSNQCQ